MRKYLLACAVAATFPATAMAADMPVKAPPPPPAVALYSWTGCYIGGNIGGARVRGGGWEDTRFGLSFGDGGGDGRFIAGGQVGCNYQFDRFVIGAEWDADWTGGGNGRNFAATLPNGNNIVASSSGGSAYVSTLAARFGFAFDRVFLYGKAGIGWLGASGDVAIANLTTGDVIALSGSGSRTGWVFGAGIEWGFADNWSVKFEYDVLRRSGGDAFTVPLGARFLPGDTFNPDDRSLQMVKLGLNYRFNWGATAAPVSSRY
jgi:outer membrane immunogenic protein